MNKIEKILKFIGIGTAKREELRQARYEDFRAFLVDTIKTIHPKTAAKLPDFKIQDICEGAEKSWALRFDVSEIAWVDAEHIKTEALFFNPLSEIKPMIFEFLMRQAVTRNLVTTPEERDAMIEIINSERAQG